MTRDPFLNEKLQESLEFCDSKEFILYHEKECRRAAVELVQNLSHESLIDLLASLIETANDEATTRRDARAY